MTVRDGRGAVTNEHREGAPDRRHGAHLTVAAEPVGAPGVPTADMGGL